ncbi:sensor histidine kinase [Actinomadura sp. CNU-125]|uniref:sensor histidine kinase n=1 Tax=Actinomadura sp. CNU-125 TaxID=1904961 RepID=UPI000AF2A705|nr:sensor histidine kinase [Actinomadura sp. CNU-125]
MKALAAASIGRWSLARRLLVLQAVVVGLLVVLGTALAGLDARRAAHDRAEQTVTAVAESIADSPNLRAALASPDPTSVLQPYTELIRHDTGIDFITIMAPDGTRYTHPEPARIGGRFVGNTGPALAGRTFSETYTGTLGPSVRTVAPVFGEAEAGSSGARRRVVALVAVGITVREISAEFRERLLSLGLVAVAVLGAGIAGSYLISARLRRQTRGAAPRELREMFDYYEAILHAVREGLLLTDRAGRIVLYNDAARDLLGLPPPARVRGRPAAELGLPDALAEALVSPAPRSDEIHVGDTRVLVVNTSPVRSGDRAMGNVVTLRDHTELQGLTGELDTVRGFAESLRSQAHEAANRLHTVVSLVELGRPEQAVEFATSELAAAQRLTDRVVGAVSEPVLAALLLGKSAEAAERGVELDLGTESALDGAAGGIEPRDLVTILGNLIDNAVDAAIAGADRRQPRVTVTVRAAPDALVLTVADSGPGLRAAAVPDMFRRGWTTKHDGGGDAAGRGLGLALVGQAVRRNGGTIEVDGGIDGGGSGAEFTVRLPVRARRTEGTVR